MILKNNKIISSFIILGIFSLIFFSCQRKQEEKKTVISVKGSDTMVNLAQKWAEVYMQKNPNVSIQVTGGGSGTGIAALINGTTNLAIASRELKDNEIELIKNKNQEPKEFKVALDGLAVIVNPSNKIDSLTLTQIRDIFIGKIKNWKEIGGEDKKITLYGRENSSGTYEFFREHVLGKDPNGNTYDFAPSTQVLQGTAALAEAVARDNSGIAYGGVGYFALRNDVKILAVKKDEKTLAILPSQNGKVNYEDIWNKNYSISRYLYIYSINEPQSEIKNFIDFILSEEGQKLVEQMEYIPLPKN
ncbi:MAG: phosphate ABC transporter substrate-binding protein [Ignavibacterium sp.]